MPRTEVNINTRINKKKDHLSSKVDSELVILNIDKGEYNGLDEIGSEIWNHLETSLTLSDIVTKLLEKYDIDEHQCTLDVIDFIKELEKAGLINIENEIE